MICTIHQPELGLYLGLIDKILQSDIFVILDIAQFKKNYWGNRMAVKTANGKQILTIPIEKHNHKPYNQIEIAYQSNWQKSFLKTIEQSYSKSPYFNEIYPTLYEIISQRYNSLAELNIELLNFILYKFNYKGRIILASSLNLDINLKATDLLMEICKKTKTDIYLSGIFGKDYLEIEKFKSIKVKFQLFLHPFYLQKYNNFEPMLSSVDLLFNYGDKSKDVLKCKGGVCLKYILDTQVTNWKDLQILEFFGGNGSGHLKFFGHEAKDLTIWEILQDNYLELELKYPNAKCLNFNSLDAINHCIDKFDIIIIDATANMDINPLLQNIHKIVDKEAYIIVRSIKQSWNNNSDIQLTKSLEEVSKDLYNLKVVNMNEFPREYYYDKIWLSNYFYKVTI